MKKAPDAARTELETLRSELDELKKRLKELEKVVNISEEDEHGKRHVCVECNSVVVRPEEDPRWISVQIDGRMTNGPFISLIHSDPDRRHTALDLHLDGDGTPHVQLRGPDHQVRGDFFIENGHGTFAVMGPENKPGAVMRAMPGGGSVAVLQPDGKARGVLIHNEFSTSGKDGEPQPATQLIFATPTAKTLLKLHADDEGSFIAAGQPELLDSAVLVSRKEVTSLTLQNASQSRGVACAVTDDLAMVSAHQGRKPGKTSDAALLAGSTGSWMSLRDEHGDKRVDISAMNGSGVVALFDRDEDRASVALSHHTGSHSSLALSGVAGHDSLRFIANKDVAALKLVSPLNEKSEIMFTLQGDRPTMFLQRDGHVQVMLGSGDNGGLVSAYGPEKEKAGFATLAGSPVAGALTLQTADGTPQLTLDATDHGGRMLLNNDIGFQRIAMATYQDGAGMILNHTGSEGVALSAMPDGGIVTVFDQNGQPVQSMRGSSSDD